MGADTPSRFLQENLLVLLCFDKEFAPLVVGNIDITLFDNAVYREVASQAVEYYKKYKEPIGDHLPDVLENILERKDSKAELYIRTIKSLYESKDTVNRVYVKDQLEQFIKTQKLKKGILDAANFLQKGELEKAEAAIQVSNKDILTIFDPGIQFGVNLQRTLSFLDHQGDYISTGIKALDALNIGPAAKELLVFVAPKGRGKSWFLINLCAFALAQRIPVLYITLEMAEYRVSQRLIQNLFGLPRRPIRPFEVPLFKTDVYGTFLEMEMELINKEETLKNPDIRKLVQQKLRRLKKPKLIIKEFPSGQLTISALRAYIGNLQNFYNFTPGLLIIDYIDLMKMDLDMLRLNLGQTYVELRGLGVEYNMAVVTPSQSNRAAEDAKIITSKYLAEDYSKGMTADTILTYNQTRDEKNVGLARLFIDKSRNEEDGRTIIISQAYSVGQFCISSALLPKEYDIIVDKLLKGGKGEKGKR